MSFDDLIKYVGFLLTVVSLIIGVDYFIHKIALSLAIVLGAAVIFIFIYRFAFRHNRLFDLRIIYHEVKIDLQDAAGDLALHSRLTKFKCLKNGVVSFTDHMSADGGLEGVQVYPGVIEEIRKEGGDLFIRSNFGKVLKKGDEIEKTITANLKKSFTGRPEYWSVRIILPTKEFKLIVTFPKDRPYQSFRGYQRITSHEKICDIQPVETLINGRATLIWSVKNPEIKDVYKLIWDW